MLGYKKDRYFSCIYLENMIYYFRKTINMEVKLYPLTEEGFLYPYYLCILKSILLE